ncbi:MAG TPA: hypothetical protein VI488_09790 [Candidatus Angelobacter sp.]
MTTKRTQHPTHGKCSGSEGIVAKRLCTIEPDHRQNAPGYQELLKAHERGPKLKVVDRGDRRNEIEATIGERVGHHIPFDELDAPF